MQHAVVLGSFAENLFQDFRGPDPRIRLEISNFKVISWISSGTRVEVDPIENTSSVISSVAAWQLDSREQRHNLSEIAGDVIWVRAW